MRNRSLAHEILRICTVLGSSLLACRGAAAQTSFGNDIESPTQITPTTTFAAGSSSIDQINLTNLQLTVNIPLMAYPQRGGVLNVGYHLSYSPNTFRQDHHNEWFPEGGAIAIVRDLANMTALPSIIPTPQNPVPVPMVTTASGQGIAIDGSGWCSGCGPAAAYSDPNNLPIAVDALGTVYYPSTYPWNGGWAGAPLTMAGKIEDRNGNYVQVVTTPGQYPNFLPVATYVDTMGRSLPPPPALAAMNIMPPYSGIVDPTISCPSSTSGVEIGVAWTLPAQDNVPATYRVCFGEFAEDNPFGGPSNITITQLTLPNGASWKFDYDVPANPEGGSTGQQYADLIRITTPSGGTISYTWGFMSIPGYCNSNFDGWQGSAMRVPTSRIVDYGGAQFGYRYQVLPVNVSGGLAISDPSIVSGNGYGSPYAVLVTDDDGNQTLHVMQGIGGSCTYREVLTEEYQGAMQGGTLLSRKSSTYKTVAPPPSVMTARTNLVFPVLDSVDDSHDKQTFQYAELAGTRQVLDSGGNSVQQAVSVPLGVSALVETDPMGNLLRRTDTTFQWQVDAGYAVAGLTSLVSSTSISDLSGLAASTAYYYDEPGSLDAAPQINYHTTPLSTQRGNLSHVGRLRAFPGENSTTVPFYVHTYDTGVPHIETDPKGNATTTEYSSAYYGAYPTSITDATQQHPPSTFQYDLTSGALSTSADPNGKTESYCYDMLGRRTAMLEQDGGGSRWAYDDVAGTVTQSTVISGSNGGGCGGSLSGTVHTVVSSYDGLGRPIQQLDTTAPSGTLGNYVYYDRYSIHGFWEGGFLSTPNGRTYITDALGRTTSIVPGGAFCYDGYSVDVNQSEPGAAPQGNSPYTCGAAPGNVPPGGSWVEFTDDAGNSWMRVYDALKRLVRVDEPDSSGNPAIHTLYSYDVLGNLLSTTQQGAGSEQPVVRRFTYDSLSQLRRECEPEELPSGTTCDGSHWSFTYDYDLNGNVWHRTDNQGITTTYLYDPLNRLYSKTANDGGLTAATLTYDQGPNAIGSLSSETMPGSGTTFSYDSMGRLSGTTWFNYAAAVNGSSAPWQSGMSITQYNQAGLPLNLTYPDGLSLTQAWDASGHLYSVTDSVSGTVYVGGVSGVAGGGVQYAAAGQPTVQTLANGAVNLATEYDDDGRASRLKVNSAAVPARNDGFSNVLDQSFSYTPLQPSTCATPAGVVGNLYAIVDNLNGAHRQDFCYDNLNRLISSARSDHGYSINYSYDSFGNMLPNDQINTSPNLGREPGSNRLLLNNGDYHYSSMGQLTGVPNPAYPSLPFTYTADGLLRSIGNNYEIGSYLYDSLGERTLAVRNNTTADEYVYLNSQPMANLSIPSGVWTDYIYANGVKLAKVSAGTVSYIVPDRLGTTQTMLASDGSVQWQGQFTPFGQEVGAGAPSYIGQQPSDGSGMPFKFTGKERDSESGLDYFGARYYSSGMGRFPVPDPWIGSMDLSNPQSLNRYSYVSNNPTIFLDPDGLDRDSCNEAGGDCSNDDGQIGADIIFASGSQGAQGGCHDCGGEDNDDPNAPNGEDTPGGQQTSSTTGPENWGENRFLTALDRVAYSKGTQHVVNFSAGYSDTFTLGGTAWANRKLGQSNFINTNTKMYWGGSASGALAFAYLGARALQPLRFLGPSKPAWTVYRSGRVFAAMYGSRFLLRVDQHEVLPGGMGPSIWHAHVWSVEDGHGWLFYLPFLNW